MDQKYFRKSVHHHLPSYLGTGGELLLPVLLVLGLFSPIATIGLSILNVMAVLSLEEIGPAAFSLHVVWGMLLALVLLWGPGRIGVDTLLKGSGRNN